MIEDCLKKSNIKEKNLSFYKNIKDIFYEKFGALLLTIGNKMNVFM